ncbi:MAG: hypothetical protein MJ198_04850 [Bacteroidales bacterium]|nr:hypothetical protein [Bacteroidales bacterium]
MNVKDVLIGAGITIIGVALGAVICCTANCSKKYEGPKPPCAIEQQECPNFPGKPTHHKSDNKCFFKMMEDELQLSEEQKAQIKSLKEEQRKAEQAEREKFDEAFKAILSDEQKAKLEELKAKKCDKRDRPCKDKHERPERPFGNNDDIQK